jgi:hypothetical protein
MSRTINRCRQPIQHGHYCQKDEHHGSDCDRRVPGPDGESIHPKNCSNDTHAHACNCHGAPAVDAPQFPTKRRIGKRRPTAQKHS